MPVLGIVENMAWFTPEKHPDERYYIFGEGGASRLAKDMGVELLAEIPLVAAVGRHSDEGHPIALEDSITGQSFMHLAHTVIDAIDRRNSSLPPLRRWSLSTKITKLTLLFTLDTSL